MAKKQHTQRGYIITGVLITKNVLLKYGINKKSHRKDATLTSWTLLSSQKGACSTAGTILWWKTKRCWKPHCFVNLKQKKCPLFASQTELDLNITWKKDLIIFWTKYCKTGLSALASVKHIRAYCTAWARGKQHIKSYRATQLDRTLFFHI